MLYNRVERNNGRRWLRKRLEIFKGVLAVVVGVVMFYAVNANAQPPTDTGWDHNGDSNRPIYAFETFDDTGGTHAGSANASGLNGDIIDSGSPGSIAGVATNDATGTFTLGNINISGHVLTGGNHSLYGFIYISDTAGGFAGTISGSTVEVVATAGEVVGVYFRRLSSGKADIAATATNITFGNITATTQNTGGATDGAVGFSAGAVANGANITLGNVTAGSTGGGAAAGVEFTGNFGGALSVGTVNVTGTSTSIASYGVNLHGTTNAGTITVGTINVTSEQGAFGVYSAGTANLTLKGNVTVSGKIDGNTSGIWANDANIILDGNVTFSTTHNMGGAWQGAAIRADNDLDIKFANFTLNTTSGGVKVDRNMTIEGTTGTASLGKANVGGAFTINGTSTDVTVGADSTFGSLSNAGILNIAAGTTTISGTVSSTGTINVNNSSTLMLSGGSVRTISTLGGNGTVSSGGNLTIGNTAAGGFTGNIMTTGSPLTINGGTFSGNLTAASSTLNLNGGTFSGNLEANTTTVGSGATLVPGNSGLTVTGDLTMSNNSTINVTLGAGNNVGTIVASGTVDIGNIDINLLNATLHDGTFTILSSTGGLTYTAGTANVLHGGIAPTGCTIDVQNDGSGNLILTISGAGGSVPGSGLSFGTPNAINAADGMDAIVLLGEETSIANLHIALDTIASAGDPQALANAFAMLHGEVFATSKEVAARQQRQFLRLIPNGREQYTELPKVWNRWGTLTGGWQGRQKIDQYSAYDLATAGVVIGVDRAILGSGLIGVALGYDYADLNFDTIRSNAQVSAARTLIYGSWYNGKYYVDAYGGYTKNFYETERSVSFAGFHETPRGSYHDNLASIGLEFGRVWQTSWCMITPSIGAHGILVNSPDVTEKDGGDANLFVRGEDYTSLRIPIGVKVNRMFSYGFVTCMPELRVVYTAEVADDSVQVRTAFTKVQDVTFLAESGEWGRHSGRAGLGLSTMVANHVLLRMDYDHEFYQHTNIGIFSATLGVQW